MIFQTGSVLIAVGLAHIANAYGQIKYAEMTGDCKAHGPISGSSVFCCTGVCQDDSTIFNADTDGQCQKMLDVCTDLAIPPSCPRHQILVKDPAPIEIDAGYGACAHDGKCDWQRNSWLWSCCDCPAGFQAVPRACDAPLPISPCVGCADPVQTLVGDPARGYRCLKACAPSGTTCDFYQCLNTNLAGCGLAGYPLNTGYRTCMRFAEPELLASLSPRGREWVADMTLCMQESLAPVAASAGTSCRSARAHDVASRPACYVGTGVCELVAREWDAVVGVVGREAFDRDIAAWLRVAGVVEECGRPGGFVDWLQMSATGGRGGDRAPGTRGGRGL